MPPDSFGTKGFSKLKDAVEEQQPRQHSCDAERRSRRQHQCQNADEDEHDRPGQRGRSRSRHGRAGCIHGRNPVAGFLAATLPSPVVPADRNGIRRLAELDRSIRLPHEGLGSGAGCCSRNSSKVPSSKRTCSPPPPPAARAVPRPPPAAAPMAAPLPPPAMAPMTEPNPAPPATLRAVRPPCPCPCT